ncbi:MAG: 6-carboxytetrahydropterin synthase [Chitinophagales bacterium]|nr:6-carboxytetrahydropterin synthase [Chitinophagales bacterium]
MVYLTRREHFNGAHRLFNPAWSEEQNSNVFGKCANKNWHGHNFDVFVTVKGKPDPNTGFIMNAHDLSRIMKREIVDRLDHKNFNLDVPELSGVLPSTENIVMQIWKWLEPHITVCQLHCIKLVETENIYVEYYGEK